MTPLLFAVAVIAELFMVVGQIMTKRSMLLTNRKPMPVVRFVVMFVPGVAMISIYFFLWLGLMQKVNLSQQYAFDVLSMVLLVLMAVLFLGERVSAKSWMGIGLICAGLVVISVSS